MNEWIKWFWNNDEGLKFLYLGALLLIPLITGALGIFSYVVSNRRDFLKEEAARTERRELERQAEDLRKQIDDTSSQTIDLQEKIEQRDDRIEKLEKKREPRKLTDEQGKLLVEKLSQFRGQQIEIFVYTGDPESHAFAKQIESALKASGWLPEFSSGTEFGGEPVEGLELRVADKSDYPLGAKILADLLLQMGYKIHGQVYPKWPHDKAQLAVGKKP